MNVQNAERIIPNVHGTTILDILDVIGSKNTTLQPTW